MSDSDVENLIRSVGLPEKSQERYNNTYKAFKNWLTEKAANVDEKSLLAYFMVRNSKRKAPTSLWSEYSMLKSTIFLNDSVDISKFSTLIAYLKKTTEGCHPRRPSFFTKEEFTRFLLEAPDEKFLPHKVGLILGVAGACRRDELYSIKIGDIMEKNGLMIVKVFETGSRFRRSFVVYNEPNQKVNYLGICHKYIKLRPKNTKSSHLFLNFRCGKCTNQVIGKGTIGSWPSKIAEYLQLKNSANYTAHSYRRTSAKLLSKKRGHFFELSLHGGWKSSSIPEGYIDDSLKNKTIFAKKIFHSDKNEELSKPSTSQGNQEDKETSECEVIDDEDVDEDVDILWADPIDGPNCSSHNETPPLLVPKLELDEVPRSHMSDHDYSCEWNPFLDIKSELEVEESEIKYSTEFGTFGDPTPECCQHLLKENEDLRKEVERLNSLVETHKQELVMSKQNEIRLEQIVQSVTEIVLQTRDTIRREV